jgi:hypothetical protein
MHKIKFRLQLRIEDAAKANKSGLATVADKAGLEYHLHGKC